MCILADGIMLGFLVCCGILDWKSKELPVWLLVLYSGVSVSLTLLCREESWESVAAGLGLGAVFFLISKVTKEAVGYGDSWLILLLGARLGIEKVLWLLFVASLGGVFVSLLYLWMHRWNRNATLPFVPFLTLAYLGVMFL